MDLYNNVKKQKTFEVTQVCGELLPDPILLSDDFYEKYNYQPDENQR
jgi:hypothetical protein